jgi:hypothetical protein
MKYSFKNFYSSINKMPKVGGGKPIFYAVVDLTVPTGGYEVSLEKDHVNGDTIYLRAKITPPTGIVTQALVTHNLRYEEDLNISYQKAVLLGPIDETNVEETQ